MFNIFLRARNFIWDKFVYWLTSEKPYGGTQLSDFGRMRYELKPGDVILVAGRSKVAEIIKLITQSIWTHSILYLGRIHDIDDHDLRKRIQKYSSFHEDDQLIIESLLSEGTIVSNIEKYSNDHLRICRPTGLTHTDAQKVIEYAVLQLGTDYNVRHLLDLARFMFPYGILPRRWRSSLFRHNAGKPTETICSTMMAEAFASVHFPIQPILHQAEDGKVKLYRRNSKLITPPDFDYSPYFDVIKYPMLDFDELAVYRKLPWDRSGVHCNEIGDCYAENPLIIDQTVDDVGTETDDLQDDEPPKKPQDDMLVDEGKNYLPKEST